MGFFSLTQELAIDLGTANTLIIYNGKVVVDEPSIVALDVRLVEISHVSFGDCFAALQIDLCVRGWIGAFTTLAAYTIPISSQTMSFPADSTDENLRQPPLPKTRRIVALPPSESNHFF